MFAQLREIWERDGSPQYIEPWLAAGALPSTLPSASETWKADFRNLNAMRTYHSGNNPDTESATSCPEAASNALQHAMGSRRNPPLCLALALMYAASKFEDPMWKDLFEFSKKERWNTSPHFPIALWGHVLDAAGMTKDEEGVVQVLREMIATRTNLHAVPCEPYVRALNAVHSEKYYEQVKPLLFDFSSRLITAIRHRYVRMRVAESIPQNDKMFYHVHWHFKIRNPMHFLPRREYFDYVPSSSVSELSQKKIGARDLLKERVKQWKTEGVLPQDYDEGTLNIDRTNEKRRERVKKEPWKKRKAVWGKSDE